MTQVSLPGSTVRGDIEDFDTRLALEQYGPLEDPVFALVSLVLGASGSEFSVQDPTGVFSEYLYTPRTDSGGPTGAAEVTEQSGSPSITTGGGGGTLTPSGSQISAQSGTPVTAFSILATGNQISIQDGTPLPVVRLLPSGSQVSEQSGTPQLLFALIPVGGQFTLQNGTPLLLGVLFPVGSQVSEQSGTAAVTSALIPSGGQFSVQNSSPLLLGVLLPTGSQIASQSGSAVIIGRLLPVGSQFVLENGVATIGGAPVVLTPSGSQFTVSAPTGFFTEYLYQPRTDGGGPGGAAQVALQSGTPVRVFNLLPGGGEFTIQLSSPVLRGIIFGTGSQFNSQSGSPSIGTFGGILFPAGGQFNTEIPLAMEVFWDLIPDSSELAKQSGTAQALSPVTLFPSGSQLAVQSGTPLELFSLRPLGSEFVVQSGTPGLPSFPITITPNGSEFNIQNTTGLLIERMLASGSQFATEVSSALIAQRYFATGSQFSVQSGIPSISTFAVFLQPFGSEVGLQGKEGLLQGTLLALGNQMAMESGSPALPGLYAEISLLEFFLNAALEIDLSLIIAKEIRKDWKI